MKQIRGVKYYDTKELSLMLGLTETTIRKYRKEKRIKYTSIGRGKYTSEAALNEFLSGELESKKAAEGNK